MRRNYHVRVGEFVEITIVHDKPDKEDDFLFAPVFLSFGGKRGFGVEIFKDEGDFGRIREFIDFDGKIFVEFLDINSGFTVDGCSAEEIVKLVSS